MPMEYILMPVLGGIIGYITNDIAIKMLFRPRKAIYIGKWKLPFTPGLIPQQKNRIARSIGTVVSAKLLDAETLRAAVLSEKSLQSLRTRITDFIAGFAGCEDTIEALTRRYVGEEAFENAVQKMKDGLERVIIQKLSEANIGAAVTAHGIQMLKEKLNHGIQAAFFGKEIMGQIEAAMVSVINDLFSKLAPGIIHEEIQKTSEELLGKRLCDLYQENQDKIPRLVDRGVALYEKVLGENMEKLVRAVDIDEIVYQKVASFDALELENLIFGIMKRELKAIVYLGALLGFLMGFLNILLL